MWLQILCHSLVNKLLAALVDFWFKFDFPFLFAQLLLSLLLKSLLLLKSFLVELLEASWRVFPFL